jgi:CRP-like cAMP-binding protein
MDINEYLVSSPLFANFPPAELEILGRALMVERYPNEHVFIKEGKRGEAVYLIIKGKVTVTRLNRQTRNIDHLRTLNEGEWFGLIALIDHGKRTATCTAQGEVTAASLPVTAFELLYQSDAPIAHHFQYLVARQLAHDMRALNHALLDVLTGREKGVPSSLYVMSEFGSAGGRP